MFGIDFGSFIIILIVAIIFLGPDKLPDMIIQIVKFIKSFKSTVQEAKDTIQKEIDIHDLKNTALSYKEKVEELTKDINNPVNMYNNKEVSDVFSDISKDFKDIEENIKKEIDSPITQQSAMPTMKEEVK
jgi:sec-independent protein translocase protein TatB